MTLSKERYSLLERFVWKVSYLSYRILRSLEDFVNKGSEEENICMVIRDIYHIADSLDDDKRKEIHKKALIATDMAKRMQKKLLWYTDYKK